MESRKFDGMIQRFSGALSRRSLVGGSLGASVLAAVGLGAETQAKRKKQRVGAEACIPSGKTCPSKKPRGKKGKKLSCNQCCEGRSITVTNSKGKQVQKCGCVSNFTACTQSTDCCSNVCANGFCQEAPCAAIGEACNEQFGRGGLSCCEVDGPTFTGNFAFCTQPNATTAGVCQRCIAPGGACNPDQFEGDPCCGLFACAATAPGATTGTCVANTP